MPYDCGCQCEDLQLAASFPVPCFCKGQWLLLCSLRAAQPWSKGRLSHVIRKCVHSALEAVLLSLFSGNADLPGSPGNGFVKPPVSHSLYKIHLLKLNYHKYDFPTRSWQCSGPSLMHITLPLNSNYGILQVENCPGTGSPINSRPGQSSRK